MHEDDYFWYFLTENNHDIRHENIMAGHRDGYGDFDCSDKAVRKYKQ